MKKLAMGQDWELLLHLDQELCFLKKPQARPGTVVLLSALRVHCSELGDADPADESYECNSFNYAEFIANGKHHGCS